MIMTMEQIDCEVSQISGTHIKRNNLRKKLTIKSNDLVNGRIEQLRKEIRALKVSGISLQMLRPIYSKITDLEIRLL